MNRVEAFQIASPFAEEEEGGLLDFTPLIDIVFLLLLFFLLTWNFSRPAALPVTLPGAASAEPAPEIPATVTIQADGSIALDGTPIAAPIAARLRDALVAAGGPAVIVRSDRNAPVGSMVEVLDGARLGNARSVRIAAEVTAPPAKAAP